MVMRLKDLPADVQRRMAARGVAPVQRSVQRARGGRRASRAGADFEREIVEACRFRPAIRLEELPKCGAKFIGKGKSHPLPIPCDFVGCVTGSGLAVFFDAKHCGTKIASFRCGDEKILKRHQRVFLERMAAAGAIAGILVKCRAGYLWLDGSHLVAGETIRWTDPRWVPIGAASKGIDFRMLVERCAKTPQNIPNFIPP